MLTMASQARYPMSHHGRMENSWPCQHFSLANPHRRGAANLPKLLRSVATEIEKLRIDPASILDLTISQDLTDNGPWWSATVYWSPQGDASHDR
jgi:hypothetical protein